MTATTRKLRRTVQHFARTKGVVIHKFPVSDFKPVPLFHMAVQLLMARKGPALSFVQVGANDGKFGDPLREYVIGSGWRGVLVEPQPDVFEALKTNYAGSEDRLAFENCAISTDSAGLTIYRPPVGMGGDLTYARSVASGDPDVIARQLGVSVGSLDKITVPCMTLDALFAKHGIVDCDVLQIDVEGLDWRVLSTLSLDKHKPAIVQFEIGHLSVAHCEEIARYLSTHGYDIYWPARQGDGVAVKRGLVTGH